MTLDDRSLREHLDRRAEAGLTDVAETADVVLARVGEIDRGPWWRRLGVRAPSLGIAAGAVAVLVIALAVLPPRIWPGPGTSPTTSDSAVARGYPADRALTAQELDALLGPNPADRASVMVIADVQLLPIRDVCDSADCPTYWINTGGRNIMVYAFPQAEPVPPDQAQPEPFVPGPRPFGFERTAVSTSFDRSVRGPTVWPGRCRS